jgi:putative oxidoreductase
MIGLIDKFAAPAQTTGELLAKLQSPLLLFTRYWVAMVFFKSGLWKINNWEQNLAVFEYEYQVPLLSYEVAAYLATFGELVFPVFLIVGLGTRFTAIAISFINIIAVVSYYATLAKGAGLVSHYWYGTMLLVNIVYGGGYFSVDQWLKSRFGKA